MGCVEAKDLEVVLNPQTHGFTQVCFNEYQAILTNLEIDWKYSLTSIFVLYFFFRNYFSNKNYPSSFLEMQVLKFFFLQILTKFDP